MVLGIVVVGGATRLTGSGLSITEWQPILGAMPPWSEADWQAAYEKYQASSQFKLQNSTMTLTEFHFIYWWEWSHRLLARTIGAVALLPFLYFAARKMLPKGQWPRYVVLMALGGLQGLLGWYMVKSGLDQRVAVSQYWLAAHLICASTIFAFACWLQFSVNRKHQWFGSGAEVLAPAISCRNTNSRSTSARTSAPLLNHWCLLFTENRSQQAKAKIVEAHIR